MYSTYTYNIFFYYEVFLSSFKITSARGAREKIHVLTLRQNILQLFLLQSINKESKCRSTIFINI